MSYKSLKSPSNPDLIAGIVAGFLGGLAGSGIKMLGEMIYPPRTQGQPLPPVVLAEKVAGHPLTPIEKAVSAQTIHWSLGAVMGAVYGAAAEYAPVTTIGYGSGFGTAVLLATHESTLPLLGLNQPPAEQPRDEHLSELFTHILYGMSTEAVRRAVRALIEFQLESPE